MNMDDLSPAFAAESLTLEIIAELKRRLESTGTYDEQLRIVTEMEDKYDLEEGILLSQDATPYFDSMCTIWNIYSLFIHLASSYVFISS